MTERQRQIEEAAKRVSGIETGRSYFKLGVRWSDQNPDNRLLHDTLSDAVDGTIRERKIEAKAERYEKALREILIGKSKADQGNYILMAGRLIEIAKQALAEPENAKLA